jgi:prepilin-type N-terminal cleavage/methylation domain-containing protein
MSSSRRERRARRGFGMIEVTMALLVLSVAMILLVKLVTWTGLERREARRRTLAVQEVSNVMERLSLEPFDEVTAARARAIAQERSAEDALPGASWDVDVVDQPDPSAPARRVSLRLRWKHASGDTDKPVELTAWIYRGRASR